MNYTNKSFSVMPGSSQQYRDNYDRIFGKKEKDNADRQDEELRVGQEDAPKDGQAELPREVEGGRPNAAPVRVPEGEVERQP